MILSQVTQQILMNYPSSLSYLVTSSIWRTKGRWRNLVAMKQSRGYFLTDPPLLENIRFLKNLISTIKISRIEQARVYSFKCAWQWVFVFWFFFLAKLIILMLSIIWVLNTKLKFLQTLLHVYIRIFCGY